MPRTARTVAEGPVDPDGTASLDRLLARRAERPRCADWDLLALEVSDVHRPVPSVSAARRVSALARASGTTTALSE